MHYDTFWYDNYEYRCDIMAAIVERLNAMVHHFARVFVVRLDITFPAAYRSTRTSEEISKLMKRLVEIYTANPSDPAGSSGMDCCREHENIRREAIRGIPGTISAPRCAHIRISFHTSS